MHRDELPLSGCTEDWEAMEGDERTRHCAACAHRVVDLSAHTEAEARALLRERPCVRYATDRDGRIRFRPALRRGHLVAAAALLAAPLAAAHVELPTGEGEGEATEEAEEAEDKEGAEAISVTVHDYDGRHGLIFVEHPDGSRERVRLRPDGTAGFVPSTHRWAPLAEDETYTVTLDVPGRVVLVARSRGGAVHFANPGEAPMIMGLMLD